MYFAQLPQHKTLTAHLDVPEMWLVTTAVAAYDLDNLKLEDLPEAGSPHCTCARRVIHQGRTPDKCLPRHPQH